MSIQPYFLPTTDWNKINETNDINSFINTELISNILHGFKTKSFPSSHSLFYKFPIFLKFRTSLPSIPNNYLTFKDFNKANFDHNILAILEYNDEQEMLTVKLSLKIFIPFLNTLTLTKNLEFILTDSADNQILVEDESQLFILLSFVN